MPHITIECSANLAEHHDLDALVAAIHRAALAHGLASPDALRTRLATRDTYRAGPDPAPPGVEAAFVAIAVRIGPGRDADTKSSFVEAVLDAAVDQVDQDRSGPTAAQPAIMWSVELAEIDPAFRINRNELRALLQETNT